MRQPRLGAVARRSGPALFLVPPCDSAVAQVGPRAALLLVVHLSSERAVEPVRQDSSFSEKQESHPALLLVVPGSRLVSGDWDACLPTAAGAPVMSENIPSRTRRAARFASRASSSGATVEADDSSSSEAI